MKKYIEPKIKAIILDPDQSILQVCKVGGIYFQAGTQCLGSFGIPSGGVTCNTPIKGVSRLIVDAYNLATDNIPS